MVCIYCGAKTQVTNSRNQKKLKQVWRRRKCVNCSNIFTTIERIDYSTTLLIANNKGEVEEFIRDKLLLSIFQSLGHRASPIADAAAITDTIMSYVLNSLKTAVIKRDTLITISFNVLKKFDNAAAVHYLAYYPLEK